MDRSTHVKVSNVEEKQTITIELYGIDFRRHPENIDSLLEIGINAEAFYFQKSLDIDAINNETKCIDRKAQLFWEIPVINAKINELMSTLSNSKDWKQ